MQSNERILENIPWTTRDVWLGVAFLAFWWLVIAIAAFLVQLLAWDVNPGLFTGVAELTLLVPVWWLTIRKYRADWVTLGLRAFEGRMVGLGCGLMVLSSVFNALFSVLLAFFGLRVQADLVPIFAELSSPWWLLITGVVVAPVVEEVFFRGFLFAGLRTRYGWPAAALISSAFFSLVHLQPTAVVPIFVLGYIFAYLYEQSDSIVPAILMHVCSNALALGAACLLANAGTLPQNV